MKAVLRMLSAWHRFFFRISFEAGCKTRLRTVIFHPADSAVRFATRRAQVADGIS
jgi:hypothetical protein